MPSKVSPVPPQKSEAIPLSVPTITSSAWIYMQQCLDSGWVSSAGPFVTDFEKAVADRAGVAHAVAMSSGTAALHLALKSVGVQTGDLVIVSNLTFVASANAIRHAGADPIFIDAEPHYWQMDPVKLEAYLTEHTQIKEGVCVQKSSGRIVRTLLPVHILGMCCEMDKIVSIAKRFHLSVVEDAAEAVGVRYKGQPAGTFGDAGVFSFNGNKVVTSGGGGVMVTSDKSKADRVRYWSTQSKNDEVEGIHNEVGFNYRMTNLQAALGLSQMEALDDFLQIKRKNAARYADLLKDIPNLTLMPVPSSTESTFWLYTILLPVGTTLPRRKKLIEFFRLKNIQTRPFWHPLHGLPPYRGCDATSTEVSEDLYVRGLSLPSSVSLTQRQIVACVETLKEGLSHI
ncbi:MAG: GDP-perosamine synthase [Elusimicrobia bacterium]|nr:GDP-perosamine synthase [Elusimicrobiota bacterium]